ncbi:MAG: hypothetical protein K2X01_10040 [Cyanobacteria bacterium]|nr:hypothetical protein [Cyanobacteriota bacterium]
MYRKLLSLINQFILVRQGMLGRSYAGRLMSVDPECIDIQTYDEHGNPADIWTLTTTSITDFTVNTRGLNAMALRVKWAASQEELEPEEYTDSHPSSDNDDGGSRVEITR